MHEALDLVYDKILEDEDRILLLEKKKLRAAMAQSNGRSDSEEGSLDDIHSELDSDNNLIDVDNIEDSEGDLSLDSGSSSSESS